MEAACRSARPATRPASRRSRTAAWRTRCGRSRRAPRAGARDRASSPARRQQRATEAAAAPVARRGEVAHVALAVLPAVDEHDPGKPLAVERHRRELGRELRTGHRRARQSSKPRTTLPGMSVNASCTSAWAAASSAPSSYGAHLHAVGPAHLGQLAVELAHHPEVVLLGRVAGVEQQPPRRVVRAGHVLADRALAAGPPPRARAASCRFPARRHPGEPARGRRRRSAARTRQRGPIRRSRPRRARPRRAPRARRRGRSPDSPRPRCRARCPRRGCPRRRRRSGYGR